MAGEREGKKNGNSGSLKFEIVLVRIVEDSIT